MKPARKLGDHGSKLWKEIQDEYGIEDSSGLQILLLACQSLDRAESQRATIEKTGEMIETKGMLKETPLLRHELAARGFVLRALSKLGLDHEPKRPVGRPGKPPGISWKDMEDDD